MKPICNMTVSFPLLYCNAISIDYVYIAGQGYLKVHFAYNVREIS